MKKFISILSVAFLATVLFNACGGNGPTTDDGVLINGVKWATRNVGSAGTFVKSPQDFGNYYTWEEAKTACPSGWRLPTYTEFESFRDYSDIAYTKQNGIYGFKVGDTKNNIFLPAAGRNYDGTIDLVGECGYYWSSINYSSTYAWSLYIDSDDIVVGIDDKRDGFPVRCVKE